MIDINTKIKINNMSKQGSIVFCRRYKFLFKGYSNYVSNIKELKSFIIGRLSRRNVLPGGYGDKLTLDKVILKELNWGIEIEYEHTKNLFTSMDIVFDHLVEYPDYYTRLRKMEKEANRYWHGKNKFNIVKQLKINE